jgi:hypothetical protein
MRWLIARYSRVMPEYNEEIVRRYFELKGYFVRSNIPYKFAKGTGGVRLV